ncbi:eukaryotic translation initiation factor 4E type 1B [Carlito syrichta]|uniref:Eukaryotic translation initiation factor 4E type 1B n=1 Tax=Carlito syrichta TaxID=1868482 RepID=A0A1U7SQ86_CARSF|nr:eukaryotic translation initiation factor 4E type 1B [Carlito syrichta]
MELEPSMATSGPASDTEGGISEQEEEEAAGGASVGEEAPSVPRRAQAEGPMEVTLHPLNSRWALWFFKNDRSRAWRDNLQLVTTFDTVEDFWALYNHIQLPSKLSSGCDYAVFKDGIQPMWEDSRNKKGGRWLVSFSRQGRYSELDRLWLETLLCLIGESFEEQSRAVCGAVVNIRTKRDKIALWMREMESQAAVLHIGRVYKECLDLPTKTIGYQVHADAATRSNSPVKHKFVL